MAGAAEALGGLLRDFGSKVTEKLRSSEIGSQFIDTVGSQRNEFMRSPEGTQILGKMDAYTQQKNSILGQLLKPVDAIRDAVKDSPARLKSNISDIHQHLTSTNHPAAQHTAQMLQQDPAVGAMNLQTLTQKSWSQASLLAQANVFGVDNANLVKDLMPLYDSPNPVMHSHADAMLNVLANQFHDTMKIPKLGVDASRTKMDVQKAFTLLNKQREQMSEKPIALPKDVKAVYEHQNELARWASYRARIYLAPMIAINHISTFFNYANAPLSAIGKAMAGMDAGEVRQLSDASGIFGSQMHQMIAEDISNRTGFVASKTGKSEIGSVLGKVFHNPGFSFVRGLQLKAGALVGYHSLMHWTEGAMKGDKRSILELKEMGIDVPALLKRGGALSDGDKSTAIFHFVNNRAFIDRSLDRSLTATKNPWTRMLTMFHGYVTSQQAFMRRELQKMMDAGDYVGVARFSATIGLVFPTVAPMIKSAEVLARTASAQQAGQGIQDDYRKLTHPAGVGEFTTEYLDMLSYFGSFGTLHSFITASHSDRLALALMGPIAGDVVRTGQDVINYATKSDKSGKHNIRPLAKDILQQTLPGAGNIISSELFPTKSKGGN